MTSVGIDVGAMWRLSEDLNVARRFAVRMQQHHHHHHAAATAASMPMLYNGNLIRFSIMSFLI